MSLSCPSKCVCLCLCVAYGWQRRYWSIAAGTKQVNWPRWLDSCAKIMFHFVIAHSEHPGAATNKQTHKVGKGLGTAGWQDKTLIYFQKWHNILHMDLKFWQWPQYNFLGVDDLIIDKLIMIFLYFHGGHHHVGLSESTKNKTLHIFLTWGRWKFNPLSRILTIVLSEKRFMTSLQFHFGKYSQQNDLSYF